MITEVNPQHMPVSYAVTDRHAADINAMEKRQMVENTLHLLHSIFVFLNTHLAILRFAPAGPFNKRTGSEGGS